MIEIKDSGKSQYLCLITPINGNSYYASKNHIKIEVNTFAMVMKMTLNADQ